jgi:hypothetical protein
VDACSLPRGPPEPSPPRSEETISVAVPPMVACFLSGPPGFRAAWVSHCPGQLVSHCKPPLGPISALGSSVSDCANSGYVMYVRSANAAPSSPLLSEPPPKPNMSS